MSTETKSNIDNQSATAAGHSKSSASKDHIRTIVFVVGAVFCLAVTGIIEWASRPAAIEEYGRVGQEFYPEFTDPTKATSLEVYAFDPEKVLPLEFRVQQLDNGRWVIPSHHNYPADAEDRLADTAASIIGIDRGALVTRWPADHAEYGVVNPKQESLAVGDVEGVGKRLTLTGEGDTILADYIIGNEVEEGSGDYYVRHPDEDEVYITSLNIDLSTKFADWIETDLLELDAADISEVSVNNYSFDELRGQVTSQEVSTLARATSTDPWSMGGLNEETEEVNEDAIRDTVDTIAELAIAGVRPKQKGLTPDLKIDRAAVSSQRDVDRLQSDLLTRGFLLQPGENGSQENLRLMAREGELNAATTDGVVYRLYFGRAFAGNQEELEIGFSNSDKEGQSKDESDGGEKKSDEAKSDETSTDDSESSEEGAGDNNNPGRYVFVRTEFDKKYLGEAPVKPTEPEMPPELKAAESAEKADATPASDSDEGTDDSAEGDRETEETDEPEEDPLDALRDEYEQAKTQYESDVQTYEADLKAFDQKIADGEKKAAELNRRFADWYYVIPGDSFDKMRLSRADLVKAKEDDEAADPTTTPGTGLPGLGGPGSTFPGLSPPGLSRPDTGVPGTGAVPDTTAPDTTAPANSGPTHDTPTTGSPTSGSPTSGSPGTDAPLSATGGTPDQDTPNEKVKADESATSDVKAAAGDESKADEKPQPGEESNQEKGNEEPANEATGTEAVTGSGDESDKQ